MLAAMPRVMWRIRREMRQNRTRGLSIPQFRTLVQIDAQPKVSLSAVAENLGASRPTASRIVGGLVKKGMIARDVCASDRRQCALRLTPAGRAVLRAGQAATQKRLAVELARLDEAERRTVADAMAALSRVFGDDTPRLAVSADAG